MPGHYSFIEHVVSVWQRIGNVLKMILKWICNSLHFLWNALATFQNKLVVLFNAFSMRWKCSSTKKPFNAIFVKPAFPKIQSHINNWKHYIFLQLIKNAVLDLLRLTDSFNLLLNNCTWQTSNKSSCQWTQSSTWLRQNCPVSDIMSAVRETLLWQECTWPKAPDNRATCMHAGPSCKEVATRNCELCQTCALGIWS